MSYVECWTLNVERWTMSVERWGVGWCRGRSAYLPDWFNRFSGGYADPQNYINYNNFCPKKFGLQIRLNWRARESDYNHSTLSGIRVPFPFLSWASRWREGIGVGSNLPKIFVKNFSKTQINPLKTQEFWTKKSFARKNAEKRVQS